MTVLEEDRFAGAGTEATTVDFAVRFVLGLAFGLAAATGFAAARFLEGLGADAAFAVERLAVGLAFAGRLRAGDSSTTNTGSADFLAAVLLFETESSNTGLTGRTIWT